MNERRDDRVDDPGRPPGEELFADDPRPSPDDDPEWFLDLLDGTVGASERRELERRLRDDPALARSFASYRDRVRLLAALGAKERSDTDDGGPALRDRILRAVRDDEVREDPVPVVPLGAPAGGRPRVLPALLGSGTLAAACLVAFLTLKGTQPPGARPGDLPASTIHDAIDTRTAETKTLDDEAGVTGAPAKRPNEGGGAAVPMEGPASESKQPAAGDRQAGGPRAERGAAKSGLAKSGEPRPSRKWRARAGQRVDRSKVAAGEDEARRAIERLGRDGIASGRKLEALREAEQGQVAKVGQKNGAEDFTALFGRARTWSPGANVCLVDLGEKPVTLFQQKLATKGWSYVELDPAATLSGHRFGLGAGKPPQKQEQQDKERGALGIQLSEVRGLAGFLGDDSADYKLLEVAVPKTQLPALWSELQAYGSRVRVLPEPPRLASGARADEPNDLRAGGRFARDDAKKSRGRAAPGGPTSPGPAKVQVSRRGFAPGRAQAEAESTKESEKAAEKSVKAADRGERDKDREPSKGVAEDPKLRGIYKNDSVKLYLLLKSKRK